MNFFHHLIKNYNFLVLRIPLKLKNLTNLLSNIFSELFRKIDKKFMFSNSNYDQQLKNALKKKNQKSKIEKTKKKFRPKSILNITFKKATNYTFILT